MLRFLIAGCRIGVLLGKPLPLVNGIVQLGIGVGHLPAVHKELKPLHIVGIVRFLLGKRRNLHRMVHHKGGLNQMLFRVLLKEQIQNIALAVALLILNMVLLRQLSGLLHRLHLIPVHTGILFHRVHHGDPAEGLAQIHLHSVIHNGGGSQHFFRHIPVQILCQVHHSVIIGISLV